MRIEVDLNDAAQVLLAFPDNGYELAWDDELDDLPDDVEQITPYEVADASDLLQSATWLRLTAMWEVTADSFELSFERTKSGSIINLYSFVGDDNQTFSFTSAQTDQFLQTIASQKVGRLFGIYHPAGDWEDDAGFWRLDYTDGARWRHAEGSAAWPSELGSLCESLAGLGLPNLFRGGQLACSKR